MFMRFSHNFDCLAVTLFLDLPHLCHSLGLFRLYVYPGSWMEEDNRKDLAVLSIYMENTLEKKRNRFWACMTLWYCKLSRSSFWIVTKDMIHPYILFVANIYRTYIEEVLLTWRFSFWNPTRISKLLVKDAFWGI